MGYHWASEIEAAHIATESLVKIGGFADADEETYDSLGRELDLEGVSKLTRTSSEPEAPTKFFCG